MKFKFNYKKNGVNFECEVEDLAELQGSIENIFAYVNYISANSGADVNTKQVLNENKPADEPASDAQKNYMRKLQIPFNENVTKIEAIDLINKFKEEHNIPITGRGGRSTR